MNSQIYCKLALWALALLLFSCQTSNKKEAADTDLPNILWIVSEDNSPFLGCYGDQFATTPVLDEFATQSILYEKAFATAPVCAPARSTLITGVYPPSMGTQHMRSTNPIPEFIHFFPSYLREAGYYCTNNSKKDYNTVDQENAWDESSRKATYKNRKDGQPFFAVFNQGVSHESSVHKPLDSLKHDPKNVPIPPYHPRTPEMEHDWAQYYDKVEMMDTWVGEILDELEVEGLAENTIVFYYSDHGGVLGRSKRFLYESGLHVPLIIHFPEKYKHLAPALAGSRTDRIVTFLDFAPTILSLVGIQIPDYMQGEAFLGKQEGKKRKYAHSFRGRMDEVFDFSRSLRDQQFRYTRNYMPHRIYGQYLEYLWRAPSMASWERAYKNGECNDAQSAFWEPKPVEELYDCEKDPHNVQNLANDPNYTEVLTRMRQENNRWILETFDSGFLPEADMISRAGDSTIYEYVRGNYPLDKILKTAEIAGEADPNNLTQLIQLLEEEDAAIRYWAATGCAILEEQAMPAKDILLKLLEDPSPNVRLAASESLYLIGEKSSAITTAVSALEEEALMARVHAFNVLKLMGSDAKAAVPNAKMLLEGVEEKDRRYDYRSARYLIRTMETK